MGEKKVGIITWHYFSNFGSALQAYALQISIAQLGYDVKILNYRNKKYGISKPFKEQLQFLLHQFLGQKVSRFFYPFVHFQKKYLKETRLVQDVQKLPLLCHGFDTIVCGSDQIWAPNVLDPVYLLKFVPENIERISYAASIGLNEIPFNKIFVYKDSISRFQAVSVRESLGAELIFKNCGITAEVVLDPTLLILVEQWSLIEQAVKEIIEKKYVFCYFLKEDHHYRIAVQKYAEENGLQVIGVSANKNDEQWMTRILKNIGPCEFLWLIHHADVVITDSYHGTIFSLLYHKKFITFERFEKDDCICQNSRIYQLKSYFQLEKQIIGCKEHVEVDLIDYEKFEIVLKKLREKSIQFLKDALRGDYAVFY